MAFDYPKARRDTVEDDYHGTRVGDPYRWAEDPDDPETKEFVKAQNELTRPYLDSLPEVGRLRERITEIWDTPRTGAPQTRDGIQVWQHNDGLSNQPVFLISRDGAEPDVLLDPNTFSEDGAVAVTAWSLSPDGSLMAYTRSEAGSDEQTGKVLDTVSGEHLDDELTELRFTNLSWWQQGFFYTRFPGLSAGTTGLFKDCSIFYHRLRTEQSDDDLVFSNPDDPDLLYFGSVSDDHRYLVLEEADGTSQENGLLFRPLEEPKSEFTRLVEVGVARHLFLDHHDGALLIQTDLDAPNGEVVSVPLHDLEQRTTLVPEGATAIENAAAAADRLVVVTLEEGAHQVSLYTLDGDADGVIELPAPGTVEGITGRLQDPAIHIGFQSFIYPPLVLRWEAGETDFFAEPNLAVDPDQFNLERHHTRSSDGADMGMFVLRHEDTRTPTATELYGYGGFNINLTPMYNPARLAWLEAGGLVVTANLRGGSEHGEEWHQQGMLGNKQQVFDDFIACAEYLVGEGLATPDSLGIRGGSNGGLLVTAVMLQRPELFGAVVSQVPVTDMYRYHHFSAGRFWTVEYGNAERDADAFAWLSLYSPLHNVEPGVEYPPILVLTAETDDRVVPMHSHKFVAELQHAADYTSENPILERVETRAGHGLGKPTSKLIEEAADIFGFMLHHLT